MPIDPAFWHERWSAGNTPWHQDAPNACLVEHFHRLGAAPGDLVLVPLCGRALDMRWLLGQRFRVLGVELSEIAVRAFFDDHGLRYRERPGERFRVFDGDRVCILCGDVFALEREDLSDVAAVYDRAALIALDDAEQARYAALLVRCLPAAARQLVVTLEYDTARMQGPPFSVGEARVRALYEPARVVERVASTDILYQEPGLRARGLEALTEHAFVIASVTASSH